MENGQRGVMEGMNMSLICYNCNLLYVHLPPPRTHVGSSLLVKLSERKMLSLYDIDTGLNDSPVEYVAVADEEHGQELQQGAGEGRARGEDKGESDCLGRRFLRDKVLPGQPEG